MLSQFFGKIAHLIERVHILAPKPVIDLLRTERLFANRTEIIFDLIQVKCSDVLQCEKFYAKIRF